MTGDALRVPAPPSGPASLAEALDSLALRRAGAVALIEPLGESCSFGALRDDRLALLAALATAGLQPGLRMLVLADFGIASARTLLACASSGTAIPVGSTSTESEYDLVVSLSGAEVLCCWDTVPPALDAAASKGRLRVLHLSALPRHSPPVASKPLPGDGEPALVMWTSGSTSLPKRVPIPHSALLARARKTQDLLALEASDACLCLMTMQYMHGINSGLLGPILCGGAAVLPRSVDRASFLAGLAAGATWCTAGAAHHNAILRWLEQEPEAARGHRLRFLRSGSSALPPSVAAALESALGVPVFESYSSTETGTMTANSPAMGRRDGTVGRSSLDDIRIVDEQGRFLGAGAVGEVVVGGDTVSLPYEGDPELAAASFAKGWFHTGDLGELDVDGYLTLRGRIKDQINRGGQKISPAELDVCATALADVTDAAAFPVPHPSLGEDVVIAVVLKPGSQRSEGDLLRELEGHLSAEKRPRRIIIVPEIPRANGNKLRRRELASQLEPYLKAPAPRTPTQFGAFGSRYLGVWRAVLRKPALQPDDDFFQSGGDSLLAAELVAALGEVLGRDLHIGDIARFPTPKALFEAIKFHQLEEPADELSFNIAGVLPPLLAFSGRYGHAFSWAAVAEGLGKDQPIYAFQPPAMDWSTVGCETLESMCAHYVGRIRAVQPRGPYRLIGNSFGGLLVFELARQIQAAGEQVERLILLDPLTPNLDLGVRRYQPPPEYVLPDMVTPRHKTDFDGQRVARFHAQSRALYVARGRFEGKLHYLLCEAEPISVSRDPRRWWRHLASDGMALYTLPGRHDNHNRAPQRVPFLATLSSILAGESATRSDVLRTFGPMRLRLNASGHPTHIDGPNGWSMPVVGKAAARLNRPKVDKGYLQISGWATAPDGKGPARWVLFFVNGRYLGRVGTGRPVTPSPGDSPPPPPFSGFWARLFLRQTPHKGRPSELKIFITQDERTAHTL